MPTKPRPEKVRYFQSLRHEAEEYLLGLNISDLTLRGKLPANTSFEVCDSVGDPAPRPSFVPAFRRVLEERETTRRKMFVAEELLEEPLRSTVKRWQMPRIDDDVLEGFATKYLSLPRGRMTFIEYLMAVGIGEGV